MNDTEKKWSRKIPFSTPWREARRAKKTLIQPTLPVTTPDPEPTSVPYSHDPTPSVPATAPDPEPTSVPNFPKPASFWTSPPPPRQPQPEIPLPRPKRIASWLGTKTHQSTAITTQPPQPQPQPTTTLPQSRPVATPELMPMQTPAPTTSLAQYAHHDDKWAVGAARSDPTPGRAYPYREFVGGQRVLAQYGHNTDKWAAKRGGGIKRFVGWGMRGAASV